MPWKEETIMSIKEEFIKRALAKDMPFSHLCDEFNITRKTGYLLLNRYQSEGAKGLIPKSKAPHHSPSKTDDKTEKLIVTTRLKEPTWGPRKISRYLTNKGIDSLPTISTIATILKRHNLVTIEESLKRQKFIRFERETPNELWQMDFKGNFQLLSREACYPLTIIDDHSRFSLEIRACENEQYLPVKKHLSHVFEKYGLPRQINVDNGNPWGRSNLIPYTSLTIWLMRLGIRVSHSRPGHPQTNGKCERFHRTLKQDLISRYPMRSHAHAQKLFDKWRYNYNHERPHEAINMDVPATKYKVSEKAMPTKLPEIEYAHGSILRKVRDNGMLCYNGNDLFVGKAFRGNYLEVKYNEITKSIGLFFGQFKLYEVDL